MWTSVVRKKKSQAFLASIDDLEILDGYYRTMFDLHRDKHQFAIQSIASSGAKTILEVACGTGYCIPLMSAVGLNYTGVDISETAIAACCLKYPTDWFFHLPFDRLSLLRPHSFDAVYSSSMLEHIGRYEEAIAIMWELAALRLHLMFYEGLSGADDNVIRFVPYDLAQPTSSWGGRYGLAVALQDHGRRDGRSSDEPLHGYFLNRFSKQRMIEFLQSLPNVASVEINDIHGTATIIRAT